MNKKKLIPVLLGSLAITATQISCSSDDYQYKQLIPSETTNSTLLPINIPFSDDDRSYLNALCALSQDIVRDSTIAEDALKDSFILQNYGYNGSITLDEETVKYIQFFADKEVIRALKEKDAKRYVELCKQHEFVMPKNILPNIVQYKNQMPKDMLDNLGLSDKAKEYFSKNATTRSALEAQYGLVVFVVAAAYAIVGVNVAALENITWVHYVTSAYYTGAATDSTSLGNRDLADLTPYGDEKFLDKITDAEIDSSIDEIKILAPEITEFLTDEDIKIIIKSTLN